MTLPDSGETVPGLAYGYAYDDIGNRTGETLSGRIGSYVTNVINAYTSRNRSRTLPVMGIANANAVISVNTVTASRLDAYWMGNVAIDGNDAQSVPVSVRGDIYEGEGESLMSARSSASSAGILSATRMETTTGSGTSHGLSMSQLRALSSSGSTVASAASRSASSAETESLTSTAYETRNGAIYTPRNPESFSYDEDGNLLSDGTWVYTWDAENRLIGMENTNDYYVATGKKQKLAFAYDETGRRVEKKVWSWNSGAWILDRHHRFLYDGWNMMAQLDGNNGNDVLKTFTWGQDISGSLDGAGGVGGLLDVQDYGIGGCSFYMYDGNGNVMGLTGYFGGFDAEYAYDPYGGTLYDNPIYSGVTKDNPFRFSTKYLDFETGLYYYGYRYYNPDQGRWISRDPIEEEGGLNLYAFVGNEPVGKWDKLGLAARKGYECCTCGPDITEALQKTLAKVEEMLNALDLKERVKVCSDLFATADWDFDFSRSLTKGCGQNDDGNFSKCKGTAVVNGKCFATGSINYMLYGKAHSVCTKMRYLMESAIIFYKGTYGRGWEPTTGDALSWARAGYTGNYNSSQPHPKTECEPCDEKQTELIHGYIGGLRW